jgi:flagellar hook-associated protein 1 FlgK
MSVSSLLSIGSRAMTASYAALQVTGNNIANANTDGYSRQSVELETGGGQYTGSGFFGKGVDVATVTRAHSDFLTREAATSRAVAAADAARSGQLEQLDAVFRTGEAGIGYAAATAFNAFVDVANRPQDDSARRVALARIGDLAARFRNASDQLDSIQAGVTLDVKTAVTSVNALTARIADLNRQIADIRGTGHAPNDLLDQRDSALSELSQYVQVSTVTSPKMVSLVVSCANKATNDAKRRPVMKIIQKILRRISPSFNDVYRYIVDGNRRLKLCDQLTQSLR